MVTINLARQYALPNYIQDALKKGLKYHEEGFSGDGLTRKTLSEARRGASGDGWSEEKISRAVAWFARHESSLVPDSFDTDRPRPSGVAWLLWGSDPKTGDKGRAWLEKKASELSKELNQDDPRTPAPKSDRIKGSEKNKPGSASTDGEKIEVSQTTERALKNKVKDHNQKHPERSKRVTLTTLKKVYRRGAGAYSSSHRPSVTSRSQWAMARVNAFLMLLREGKPKNPKYVTDFDLLPDGHPKQKKDEQMHKSEHKKKQKKMYGRDKKKLYSASSVSLSYPSEHTALQSDVMPAEGTMRHNIAPGIDVIIDASDTVHAVIADASKHTIESFKQWLTQNEYKTELSEGDGIEREDGGKSYRLDDGSDQVQYSKPVTTGSDLTFFALTDDADAKDLHILNAGPLYDLDSGELVLSLSEDRLRSIAATSQAILSSGHAIPLSFEHGIEAGYRGVPSADRRPYGEITAIYYDDERKAIFGKKRWTSLGRDLVQASMVDGDVSALKVSPRVRLTPAYHPETGAVLGESGYIDVVSLTTLPRQAKMKNVALSRAEGGEENKEKKPGQNIEAFGLDMATHQPKGCNMAGQKKAEAEQVYETLLSRGTSEASRILDACELDDTATGEELSRKVADMKESLNRAQVELNRYKAEEAERQRATLEAEANELLDSCELQGAEREFYRQSLLSDSVESREFARKAIEEKGAPDQMIKVTEAIEMAKERGALTADFTFDPKLVELARDNADTVVAVLSAMPANQVVRVGEPSGMDAAGIDATVQSIDPAGAERELSRLARKLKQEGKAKTLVSAWELARSERADLVAAMTGE